VFDCCASLSDARMPLPWWASDLRGAFLGLAALVALDRQGFLATLGFSRSARRATLATCSAINVAGLVFSLAFYVHTTRTVFGRSVTWHPRPFWHHLKVTRPLEALWRFLTAPLRVLPELQILGEVRTGTTSLAAHLRAVGCIGPFSPWIAPLASDKESFYFAGHYFGIVHPFAYRMCFPLKITMWFRRRILCQAAPVFDACASHLNAPWAATLMREACPDAGLAVVLRRPEEQNVSWWKLEQSALAWAESMGMSSHFLREDYPPKTFSEALQLSRSTRIEALYKEGERAGARYLAADGPLARIAAAWLPEHLLPFPGGQLAALAHMGRYADNIRSFGDAFGMSRMVFLDFGELTRLDGAVAALKRLSKVATVLDTLQAPTSSSSLPQLNASAEVSPEKAPDASAVAELRAHYAEDNRRLCDMIGRDLGWGTSLQSVSYRGG